MPIVRFNVRNEYKLGLKELYKDGVEAEDPKAALDGVAVAALVGLLRQLGDLSQFAAEVFHGLQEQVASTASRSRVMVTRLQCVEASLPALEKAILSQTSHVHLFYTPGLEWHPRVRIKQNYFLCDDLPHFVMDSYEDCREPPRLQLLDSFDTGGPGSCFKRYSDPGFFSRASASSEASNREKSLRERKIRKIKKWKSWQRSDQFQKYEPNINGSASAHVSSQTSRGSSTQLHTGSTFDMIFRSDLQDQSVSVCSKEAQNFTEYDSHPSTSLHPQNMEVYSTVDGNMDGSMTGISPTTELAEQIVMSVTENRFSPASELTIPCSSSVTWDEKLEIMEQIGLNCGSEDVQHASGPNSCSHDQDFKPVMEELVNKVNDLCEQGSLTKSNAAQQYPEPTMDLKLMNLSKVDYHLEQELNHADPESNELDQVSDPGSSPTSDTDGHFCTATMDMNLVQPLEHLHEQEIKLVNEEILNRVEDLSEPGSSRKLNLDDEHPMTNLYGGNLELTELDFAIDGVQDLHETNFDLREHDVSQPSSESFSHVTNLSGGEDTLKLIAERRFRNDPLDGKLSAGQFEDLLGNGGYAEWEMKQFDAELVGSSLPEVAVPNIVSTSELATDGNFAIDPSDGKLAISDVQCMLETNRDNGTLELMTVDENYVGSMDTLPEDETNFNAIEWHHRDDIDSETDNFVDALNMIESDSESDYESQTRTVGLSSKYELAENPAYDLMVDGITDPEVDPECHPRPSDHWDGVSADSEHPRIYVSLSSSESLENAQPSQNLSEAAIGQEWNEPIHFSQEHSVRSDLSSWANNSEATNFCANAYGLQPAACNIAPSSSEVSPDNNSPCTAQSSQKLPFGSTSSLPRASWTNGTLFGLQPSKPTVFSVSRSVSSVPVSSTSDIGVQRCPEADGRTEPPSSSVKACHHNDNLDSGDQDIGFFTHTPPNVSEKTSSSLSDHNESKSCDGTAMHDPVNIHATFLERKVPAGADCKDTFSETTRTSEDRSSILSFLGCGLNKGLRRSGSVGYDEKSTAASNLPTTNDFVSLDCIVALDPLPESKLNGKLYSLVNSPPPSPPLEHMKVSFPPVRGFETSRLKLNHPEGIEHHEGTVDDFPSFQLIPDSTRLQQGMASESDDDTFCQSYPCLSDDTVCNSSDSDSEQWESGDTSESNEQYYEDLCRMSSIESGSSSPEHDVNDQGSAVHSMSGPTCQLPILYTRKQFANREMQVCLNHEGDSSHAQGLMPQPPPLPPLLWHVSKPVLDAADDRPVSGANLNHFSDNKLLESIAHPASLGSTKLRSTIPESDTLAVQNKKLEELKVNDQKQDYHLANGRKLDDQEDFLHQIRSKSFNLKRTQTAGALYTPSPVAIDKVTAILQKANAIRKAVASDGEDSSWSDT